MATSTFSLSAIILLIVANPNPVKSFIDLILIINSNSPQNYCGKDNHYCQSFNQFPAAQ